MRRAILACSFALLATNFTGCGSSVGYAPKAGDKRMLESTSRITLATELGEQRSEIRFTRATVWELKVINTDRAGNTTVEATLSRNQLTADPGAPSAFILPSWRMTTLQHLHDALAAMEGLHLTVRLSPRGDVQSLGDVYGLAEQTADRAKLSGAERDALVALLTEQLSPYALEAAFSPVSGWAPPEGTSVGESWTEPQSLFGLVTAMRAEAKRTLKSQAEGQATIESELTVAEIEDIEVEPGAEMSVKRSGLLTERVTIDTDTGWPSVIARQGTISINYTAQNGNTAMRVDLGLDESIAVKSGI